MSDELEALLRLVSEGRITAEEAAPIVAAHSHSAGKLCCTSSELRISVYVESAPMVSAPSLTEMPRNSSRCQMSRTRSGGGASSPVIWTIRSVPPAMGRSPSVAASMSSASTSVRGETTGGSTAAGISARRPPWRSPR